MRRASIGGVVVALLALGAGALIARSLERQAGSSARAEASRAALSAGQRAGDALRLQVKSLEIRASAAAGLQQLTAQLKLLQRFALEDVARTLEDWFQNEPHWGPYRNEFPIYGISAAGEELQFLHGEQMANLPARELVRAARREGLASATVLVGAWPYAAAAARVEVSSPAPVLLVARPFGKEALAEIAERAGGAVLLTDGRRVLSSEGPAEQVRALAGLVGRDRGGEAPVAAEDGRWAAARTEVASGLWLWVYAAGPAAGTGPATTTRIVVWSAAALVAALALVVGLAGGGRSRARAPGETGAGPAPVPAPEGAPGPSASAPAGSSTAAARAPGTSQEVPDGPTRLVAPGAEGPAPVALDRTRPLGWGAAQGAGGAAAGARANEGAGRPFGRYLLLDRLGEGGMAQVFTAVTFGAEGFRRKFVIKRLRPELSHDPAVVAQFIDEANLASSLVHSNIVPVFDFGKEGGEYYLATEYILGRDLGRVVLRMGEVEARLMPVSLALFCAQEILKALEYAHTKLGENGQPLGIVHRDVSPSNVLVSARGEVKLFDFGIVKAEGRVTRTQHGVVKGNVSFMSPEQARGLDLDGRADLFALGLVLFYCLTGELLYRGNTTYELLVKAATGPQPDERARIDALPSPAAAIVARALEVEPGQRYQSAGEFAAAIAPFVRAGGRELAEIMQRLFADEFRAEERRFAAPAASEVIAGGGTRG